MEITGIGITGIGIIGIGITGIGITGTVESFVSPFLGWAKNVI